MRKLFLIIVLLVGSIHLIAQDQTPSISTDGTLRRIRVPILMYHYVSDLPSDADAYRINLTLSPTLFRDHMQYLSDNGYHTTSLYEINDALNRGTPLPAKSVVLTFDDGYIDHYTNVFPILKEFGLTATFFIITDFADNNQSGYLTWQQIIEMADAGMDMESHTKSHADLRNRSNDFLVYEILGSIQSLNAHLNASIQMFAFPVGHYDDNTLKVVSSANVLRAVTTQMGALLTTDNLFELPRLRISNETGVDGLKYLLNYNK